MSRFLFPGTHIQRDTHLWDSHRHRARRPKQGFVLIATLWTLAAMAVLAAYIDSVASADIERAVAADAALERELARRSTEATIAYLFSTGRLNHRGLMIEPEQSFSDFEGNRGPDRSVGMIGVTGETYAGLGGTRFSIQDENGLVSVNVPLSDQFAAVLSYVGVASADIARIVPRLVDYVDLDDELSLSGAERFDYEKVVSPVPPGVGETSSPTGGTSRAPDWKWTASYTWPAGGIGRVTDPATPGELRLPTPSNWTLATPWELRRVLGVDHLITTDQWRRLLPMLTMRRTAGFNLNTLRPDVLAAILELDQAGVDNLLAARAQRPVVSLNLVAMLTGTHVDIDPMSLQGLPSGFLRIHIWHNADGLRYVAGLALTPFADAPWRIDYRYTEPLAFAELQDPAHPPAESRGDPAEPAIDNESSHAGVLQAATPLLQ